MKFPFKSVVWLFVAVITAPATFLGQNYPMPGSSSQPPVTCVSCGNLPTYPYSAPILNHRGRFLDSTKVRSLQAPIRTYRAERVSIVPERDRIYMKFGSTFVSYRLSTFFVRDLNGPATAVNGRDPAEQYLQFIDSVYPEKQGWEVVFADGQERLALGYDWDDRGYVYLPYTIFGWGIVQDREGSFTFVKQMGGPLDGAGSDVTPKGTISFKSEGKYYVYVYDTHATRGALFDVTNPSDPTYVKPLTHAIYNFAKATIGGNQVIGYTDPNTGEIKLFSAAGFIAGAGPEKVIAPSDGIRFMGIASDGTQFFGVEGGLSSPGKLAVISPNGSDIQSFSADRYSIPGTRFNPASITYSMGVVTTVGYGGGGNDLHMFRLTSGAPEYVDFREYFKKYYSGTTDPVTGVKYAGPPFCETAFTGAFYKDGSKEYVIFATSGLGDVYQIQASDGISIERDTAAGNGTANPHSEGSGGPFYGDVFRFKTASTGAQTAITVDYGNLESATGNILPATTGQSLSYRYSGLNSAAKIQKTRTVKIASDADSTKTSSINVTMDVPVARVRGWRSTGIKDPSLLFIQPNASATAPLVLGDAFADASDGTVESHYSSWVIDGAVPVAQLPSALFGAGQCGSHTLSFSAAYGAYDSAFTSRSSPDYSVGVSNIQYAVRPFASRISVVASDASGIRFRPDIRVGTGAVTGGSALAATVLWELLDASGQPVRNSLVTSTLADTAEFSVSSGDLTTGNSVRLTVTLLDGTAIVGQGCSGMTSSSDSVQLLVPDPVLTVSGCTHVSGPCSVTAGSTAGQNQSAWTYTWFLNNTQKSATGKTYAPSSSDIGQPASYTVKVRVQNEAGITATSGEKTFSLQPALCTSKPKELSFTYSGLNGSCLPGTCTSANTLQFNPKAWGYTFQDCDRFTWTFGDGSSSTDKYAQHKFNANGTYTVRMTVTNDVGSDFVDQTVQLGASTPPPPPPPSGCDAPSQLLGFNTRGTTTGCTGLIGAPDCATGESISFTAVNFPQSKAFQSCDSFTWEFGDGSTASQQNPTKVYAQGGSYNVKLTVSNTSGSVPVSMAIKVTGGSTPPPVDPSCKAPTDRAFIEITAPSGCSSAPGATPCNPGEVVTLSLQTIGAAFQSCDTFDWNFGDGTTTLNTKSQSVQHTFPATLPEYTVTVTVKNAAGSVNLTEKVRFGLLGADKPTSVDFTVGGATPTIGVPVTFTATATAPAAYPVTSWQWNFGDGITASGNPVQHTFSTEGTWNVTLTAGNAGGAAPPVTKQIKVLKANAFTYLLPVVSHLNGANGSKWKTDLQIYNGNVGEGDVELEFELTNVQGMKKNFALKTSTLILEDFMSLFRDDDWAGPVIVRGAATHDLQIWTRTYSVGASGIGTYGHLIPAVRIDGDQNLTAGETTLHLTGVSATSKYRTNFYLLNISSAVMPVTITAYNQFGETVAEFSKQVAPLQLTPMSASEIVGAPIAEPFSLSIKGTSDLIAYESVVDNGSNDPIYMPAIATTVLADPAMRYQIVPSVGHFQTWRSDLTIFNPDEKDAIQFDLSFYDGTGKVVAEANNQILPKKGLLQLDDIVWSYSMIPQITSDVIGTLRVNVDSPLADQFPVVAQRNYSDSGGQRRFGQGILGFAAAKPNVSTGKPAILPGVRSDQLYKSNVGLVNVGTSDANVTISLLDQNTGQTIAMYPVSLKPNESRIVVDAIPNAFLQTADRGSIKVEVTNESSVWAFAAIIDRTTNDPEYVPAIPLD